MPKGAGSHRYMAYCVGHEQPLSQHGLEPFSSLMSISISFTDTVIAHY